MTLDEVEAYLVRLTHALRRRGASNLRMLEEARGHLADAVEQGIQRGLDPHAAQREAIAQFGPAESVAATFAAEMYGRFDRLVLLAAAVMGIAIAYVDSRATWGDTGVTAVSLIVASALCGFAAPRRPWRWALAVGIWVAVFALLRSASLDAVVMLVVVMFTLAGAYIGAVMRLTFLRSAPRVHGYQIFHDMGAVTPEVAAVLADPDTQLVPYLTRIAPAPLGPLGNAHVTRLDDRAARSTIRKFEVVFGEEKKVLCRIEIGRNGKRVSVHWSRG